MTSHPLSTITTFIQSCVFAASSTLLLHTVLCWNRGDRWFALLSNSSASHLHSLNIQSKNNVISSSRRGSWQKLFIHQLLQYLTVECGGAAILTATDSHQLFNNPSKYPGVPALILSHAHLHMLISWLRTAAICDMHITDTGTLPRLMTVQTFHRGNLRHVVTK